MTINVILIKRLVKY